MTSGGPERIVPLSQEFGEVSNLHSMVERWQVHPPVGRSRQTPPQKRELRAITDMTRKPPTSGERGTGVQTVGSSSCRLPTSSSTGESTRVRSPSNVAKSGRATTSVCTTQHQRVHTLRKPYTCQVWARPFRVSSHLVQHHSVHSGERPYGCPECGKSRGRSLAPDRAPQAPLQREIPKM